MTSMSYDEIVNWLFMVRDNRIAISWNCIILDTF